MNRGMQFLDDPFNSDSPTIPAVGVGGSNPHIQDRHIKATLNQNVPQASTRIYNAPALLLYEPPEGGKNDNVENIYLPPNRPPEIAGDKTQGGATSPLQGSFAQQFVRWLKTGRWS